MDDAFIKTRLRYQDKKVFDFVFVHYYTGLCAFAYGFIKDRNTAEDIVQDFFMKFWSDCEIIEINGSLKNYFFSSVRNRSLDYIKHQKVHSKYVEEIKSSDPGNDFPPEYTEEELFQLLELKIKELPGRCREIFILSRFEGLSNKEIAGKLGISRRTVELQISNAFKFLRKVQKNS